MEVFGFFFSECNVESSFPGMLEQPVVFGRKSSVSGVGPGTTLLTHEGPGEKSQLFKLK